MRTLANTKVRLKTHPNTHPDETRAKFLGALAMGHTIADAARLAGVPVGTGYSWVRRWSRTEHENERIT